MLFLCRAESSSHAVIQITRRKENTNAPAEDRGAGFRQSNRFRLAITLFAWASMFSETIHGPNQPL